MRHIFAEYLPMSKFTITLDAAIAELKAELALRKNVYRNWIRAGRMNEITGSRKFASMCAALQMLLDLQKMAADPIELRPADIAGQLSAPRDEEGLPDDKPAGQSAKGC